MIKLQQETMFAPAERASEEQLHKSVEFLEKVPVLKQFINIIPEIFLILNKERQIVFANKHILDMLNVCELEKVYGKRPGEALNCVHADKTTGGCGTTEFCRYCGAAGAILQSHDEGCSIKECRLTDKEGHSSDLLVNAKQLTLEGEEFTVFVAQDISNEKRRNALERIFFHDMVNTVGSIQGLTELMKGTYEEEFSSYVDLIECCSQTLIEDIRAQKDILAAENGTVSIEPYAINTQNILFEIKKVYQNHIVADERNLIVDESTDEIELISDTRLVKRVISNMVKNALEATPIRGTVKFGATGIGDEVEFWVHNPMFMKREYQLQVFNRSFSTKGKDRGLGTYSIKMLSEEYLGGKVSFTTSEVDGTTFRVRFPLNRKIYDVPEN